ITLPHPPRSTPFPYTTLFRSRPHRRRDRAEGARRLRPAELQPLPGALGAREPELHGAAPPPAGGGVRCALTRAARADGARSVRRSEEHTSELQSRSDLVCRLL